MTWQYEQSTGNLNYKGVLVATGYAGYGEGKNNPAMQLAVNIGPLPRGIYYIGPPTTDIVTGRYTLSLDPSLRNVMFGRTDFKIHGDSIHAPGTASRGCIVLDAWVRARIWESNDRVLEVIE